MKSADEHLIPWFDHLLDEVGPLDLIDAHTHIGQNDPDGFKQTTQELVTRLGAAGARGVVFPMHEPDGYPEANDAAIAAAAEHPDTLWPYCRVSPHHEDAIAEATRALDAGARGIKLHPRAEDFTLGHDRVRPLIALAHERRAPVLIHAGRGIPALGRDTLHMAEEFPDARLILAHACISDLAWMHRLLPSHPNVLIDTSWWNPSDILALFAYVAPAQILFASDAPYGTPLQSVVVTLRCALETGLSAEQIRGVAGGTMRAILDHEDLPDLGPAPGPPGHPLDPLMARVSDYLVAALNRRVVGDDGDEPVALARLSCDVPTDSELAPAMRSVLALIDRSEELRALPEEERGRFGDLHVLACALTVARTPAVGLPEL